LRLLHIFELGYGKANHTFKDERQRKMVEGEKEISEKMDE